MLLPSLAALPSSGLTYERLDYCGKGRPACVHKSVTVTQSWSLNTPLLSPRHPSFLVVPASFCTGLADFAHISKEKRLCDIAWQITSRYLQPQPLCLSYRTANLLIIVRDRQSQRFQRVTPPLLKFLLPVLNFIAPPAKITEQPIFYFFLRFAQIFFRFWPNFVCDIWGLSVTSLSWYVSVSQTLENREEDCSNKLTFASTAEQLDSSSYPRVAC